MIPQPEVVNVRDGPAALPLESVTLMVNVNGPDTVGVPLITPVVAFKVNPVGSVPEFKVNVYGAVPPVGTIVEEYATPTCPVTAAAQAAVSTAGEMVMPQAEVIKTCAGDAAVPLESVTLMVKLKGPVPVGVPVIAPVLGFRNRPGGKAPEFRVKVYGAVPPVATMAEPYWIPTCPVVAAHVAVKGAGNTVMPQPEVI